MRRPDPPLADALFREPFRFDFFQAVRLLERLDPARVPVGYDGPPDREAARFLAHLTLGFPASSIHGLTGPDADDPERRPSAGDPPAKMVTSFMGLVGPLSALPTAYTEDLVGPQGRHRKPASAFLNLFHHRLVSLFYRAWQKYRVPVLWEQGGAPTGGESARGPGRDPFTRRLFDLIGLGLESLRDRQSVDDVSLLFYSGLLAQQHRSAVSLERVLGDYFGQPVEVITFQGQWLHLQPAQRSRMGRSGSFNALGLDTVAGRRVWDDQSKFRVRVGPLPFETFLAFQPGGSAASPLMDLVRFFVRAELDFDIQLVLRAEDVPGCKLSRSDEGAARLGRYSWLKRREFTRDADQAVFRTGR